MISRKLVAHFLSRSFFSASPEFVCQNCQKCQTTRGGEKERQKRQFLLSLGRVFQFHVLCRLQAARNLSVKTVKSVKRPGGRKRASKASILLSLGRVFQFHVLCRLQAARNLSVKTVKSVKRPGGRKRASKASILLPPVPCSVSATGSPEFVCQNCQKCQTTRGAKKSVKSVTFALSGEGVPVPCSVSATGSPEFVCENCQKCQTTWERKRASKASILLSLGRVFQFHVLCRLQASFRDMGQNSTFRRPVDSAMCGPELKQSLVLKNACKEPPNGFKGAPSQQLRRPATRKPALAGF